MTVSIMRAGYLFRWIAVVNGKCDGYVVATWDQALDEATEAAERMRRATA